MVEINEALFSAGSGGFWIMEDGTPLPVTRTSHAEAVREHFTSENWDDYNMWGQEYRVAMDHGWVHISHPGHSVLVEFHNPQVSLEALKTTVAMLRHKTGFKGRPLEFWVNGDDVANYEPEDRPKLASKIMQMGIEKAAAARQLALELETGYPVGARA